MSEINLTSYLIFRTILDFLGPFGFGLMCGAIIQALHQRRKQRPKFNRDLQKNRPTRQLPGIGDS